MLPSLQEAAVPTLPLAAVTDGVTQLDVTASSQLFAIPSSWRGRYVTMAAHGEKIEIGFGGSGLSLTFEEASAVDGTTKVITTKVGTGFGIPAGGIIERFVPLSTSITHFALIAASTTGKFYAYASSR